MPTTTNGLTYPAATATPDVPRDIQQLAVDVEAKVALGAMAAYVPTLSGWTIGNGVMTGASMKQGRRRFGWAKLTFGTTTVAAAAAPKATLPEAAAATGVSRVQPGLFTDTGVNSYVNNCILDTTTTVAAFIRGINGLLTAPSTTVPFTWANTDQVLWWFDYETAV